MKRFSKWLRLWGPMILLALIALTAGGMLLREIYIGRQEQAVFEEIKTLVDLPTADPALPAPNKVAQLREQYPDVTGWITIEGTAIDYPVVHTPSHSEKYLRMDLDGNYARCGVPFLDGRVTVDSPHLIIYGHNMINGTMFSDLTRYTEPKFVSAHPIITLTLEKEERTYRIFAVVETDGRDLWYKAMTFSSAEEYQKQIAALSLRSLYKGEPPEGKQLLTLSTCTGLRQQKRLLIVAAQID